MDLPSTPPKSSPAEPLLENKERPAVKRNDTVPTQSPQQSRQSLNRRVSQPENGARSTKLANGSTKMPHDATPANCHLNLPSRSITGKQNHTVQKDTSHPTGPNSAREQHTTVKSTVSGRKPPEFGKGRLERGKQISHLGLFPIQRQSTSMNAEAGDHVADLADVISPNINHHESRHSVHWRQQVDHIAKSLLEYAETHPHFSSQLTSCKLENIIGLKTMKPIKGDELTVTINFSITPLIFDFRTSGGSVKGKSERNTNSKPRDNSTEQQLSTERQPLDRSSTESNPPQSPSKETLSDYDQENP